MKSVKLLATGLACMAAVGATQAKESQPNVIFILVDDLGYGDLSCYGADLVSTPNIDKLAAEGRQFLDAHSASSVSTASRYSMLTGQYAFRGSDNPKNPNAGIWGPLAINSQLIIKDDLLTMPELMQAQGYTTGCIGKWHLGWGATTPTDWNDPKSLSVGPMSAGFDYSFTIPHVSSAPPYLFIENDHIVGGDASDPLIYVGKDGKNISPTPDYPDKVGNLFSGALAAHELYKDDELGEKMAEVSVKWISENKDKPFFLYLATPHIHHPFTPGKKFLGSSKCGLYGDFIQEMDWVVGEVMACLEREGIDKNTLVVFTSDNGGMFHIEGQNAFKAGHRQNGDLLGHKFGIWEGGHRVPFIARWPKQIKKGSTSDQLICNVDMMATMAALTGYKLQDGDCVDSYNVLDAFTGNPKEMIRPELLLTCRQAAHQAIRVGDWVYIPKQGEGGFGGSKPGMHGFGGAPAVTFEGLENSDIENGKFKADAPKTQLYNVVDDMSQTKNVVAENPEIAAQLKARLAEIKSSTTSR
ncbi:MAG: arylsulfatase [Rikenellaceae bacterium]